MRSHATVYFFLSQIVALFLPFASQANTSVYSEERLEEFYNQFLCEEKNTTSEVGVTTRCSELPIVIPIPPPDSCGALLARPTVPALAMPASSTSLVPFVLVNNTGLSDDDVYFVIYGKEMSGCTVGNFSFVSFGPQPGPFTAVGTTGGDAEATGNNMPPSATYSYKFSDIPLTNGQRILYIPYLSSGIILFSIDSSLDLTVMTNSIAVPIATYTSDPAYFTVYGGAEFSFVPPDCGLNQLTFDFTCVDYYGLSIYFNLFTQTPSPGLPQNRPSGIYQSRHHTLCELQNSLNQAFTPTLSQWTGLVQLDGEKILRVVSPGYSMSHTEGTFDPNYFDNALDYGYSWANDVWTGSSAYFLDHILKIQTNDGTEYNCKVVDGIFTFSSTSTTEKFGIPWSNAPLPPLNFTSSTALFNVATYFPGMTYSFNGSAPCTIGSGGCNPPADALVRANEITEYFSATMAVSLLPGKVNKLTPTAFPPSLFNSYNTPNPYLTPPGTTTGPWYDLYSVGLISNAANTGNSVYTYAYDDYLYHQAPVNRQVAPSQATIDSTTYITIFLGPYSDN